MTYIRRNEKTILNTGIELRHKIEEIQNDFFEIENFNDLYDYSNVRDFSGLMKNSFIQYMPKLDCIGRTSLYQTFDSCINLKEVRLFNTRHIKNMRETFSCCGKLKRVFISDVRNVLDFNYAFYACQRLKKLNRLDLLSVREMEGAFIYNDDLEHLEINGLSQIENIERTFFGTPSLRKLKIFDISKVKRKDYVFKQSGIENIIKLKILMNCKEDLFKNEMIDNMSEEEIIHSLKVNFSECL